MDNKNNNKKGKRNKQALPEKKRCPECGAMVIPGARHGRVDTDFKTYLKEIECKRRCQDAQLRQRKEENKRQLKGRR